MSEEIVKDSDKLKRDERGRLLPGQPPLNPSGRTPDTEETKAKKKALKQIVKEYIDKLADALPEISPALIEKAKTGDVSAIREIHDRVMGKPKQSIEVEGELNIYKWGNEGSDNLQSKEMGDRSSQEQSKVEDSGGSQESG